MCSGGPNPAQLNQQLSCWLQVENTFLVRWKSSIPTLSSYINSFMVASHPLVGMAPLVTDIGHPVVRLEGVSYIAIPHVHVCNGPDHLYQ